MRDHLHFASARRDDRLARIRKLTLWIGGGAAAATLGLGTAFAHALPGHAAGSQTAGSTAGAGSPGRGGSAAASASPARGASGSAHGSASGGAGSAGAKQGHHHALAKPAQQPAPAPAPAPPVVHSGGS